MKRYRVVTYETWFVDADRGTDALAQLKDAGVKMNIEGPQPVRTSVVMGPADARFWSAIDVTGHTDG